MLGTFRHNRQRPDDRVEILGFQTRPPDQSAADFRRGEELACICRIYRAAIENADFSAWSAEARHQTLLNVGVHFYHRSNRGRMVGSNGPERFVPNRITGRDNTVRYASGDLLGAYDSA